MKKARSQGAEEWLESLTKPPDAKCLASENGRDPTPELCAHQDWIHQRQFSWRKRSGKLCLRIEGALV